MALPKYVRDAQNAYNSKFDLVQIKLPKGTKEKIREIVKDNDTISGFCLSAVLDKIESIQGDFEPEMPQSAENAIQFFEEMPQNSQGQAETELDKMTDQIGADQGENQAEDHPGDPVELSTWTLPQKSHAEDTENPATAASIMEEFNNLREKMQQEKEEKERAKQEAKEEATRQYIEQLKKIRENGIELENKIRLADF